MGKAKKTLIGYKYYIGMHLVWCIGADSILRFLGGDDKVISDTPMTGNTSLNVNLPDLYGGDTKEGGIVGQFDFEFGEQTQGRNDYLVAKQGGGDPNKVPAYRGVVGTVIRHAYMAAMSPNLKPLAIIAKNVHQNNGNWYPTKADMNGDCNPIHVAYAALTSIECGLGLDPARVNVTSFQAAADLVYIEGYAGMSFKWNGSDDAKALLNECERFASGACYCDPATNQYVFKLFRQDYDPATLVSFDESNIVSLDSFQMALPSDTINQVTIKYTLQGTKNTDSVTVQDGASIQSQGGVNPKDEDFLQCGSSANASKHAARRIRDLSSPLISAKFKCNRDGWKVRIGDCIKFSWSKHNVANVVMRVTNANYGTLEDGTITFDCVQDVFGLAYTQYLAPVTSAWTNPIAAPSALGDRRTWESTFYEIRRATSDADAAGVPFGAAYLSAAAAVPGQLSPSFGLYDKLSTATDYALGDTSDYAPVALVGSATKTQTTIVASATQGNFDDLEVGSFAYWDNEIVRFDAWNDSTNTLTLGRGCLDTVPTTHASGSKIYFVEDHRAVDPTQYATGETLNAKLTMNTAFGSFPIASATTDSVTLVGRYDKPYPPAKVQFNGSDWPATLFDAISITWAHRNRLQELAGAIDQTSGNIGPEAGTTYNVRAYDAGSNALLIESLGIVGTSAVIGLPSGSYNARIEIESTRGGDASFQKQVHTFAYTKASVGRVLEDGTPRNLESGAQRMLE